MGDVVKGHTIKSNARRAARKAGLDCDTLDFVQGEDGLWRWREQGLDEDAVAKAVPSLEQPDSSEHKRSEEFPGEAGQPCDDAAPAGDVACAAGEPADAVDPLPVGRVPDGGRDLRAEAEALLHPSSEPRVGGRRNKEKALCEGCEARGVTNWVEAGEGRQKLGADNRYDVYCCDCYAARFPAGAARFAAAGEGAAAGSRNTPAAAAEPKLDKMAVLAGMLRREAGVTLAEGAAATGWKAHTVRGRLSDLGRNHGFVIAKAPEDGRGNVYRGTKSSGGPDAALGAN